MADPCPEPGDGATLVQVERRRMLVEALMWTVVVEVTLVGAEHGPGVAFVVDQQPVGALGPDAAHEPLREAVRTRRAGWGLHHLDVLGREHGVERAGELRVPVPSQEPKSADPTTEVHPQAARLLGGPPGRRVGGDAEDV